MKRLLHFFMSDFALLFLCALTASLPLTFPSLFLLSWVSFAPFFLFLFRSIGKGGVWRSYFKGVFFGFFYHLFVYFWFLWLYPLDFAGLDQSASVFVILLAWIGISAVHALPFGIPPLLCRLLSEKTQNRPALALCGIIGILFAQRTQSWSELAFPWVRISLGQYRAPALIQSASLFGSEGVDFLILSVSALIALACVLKEKKRLFAFGLAILLFSSNLAFGLYRLSREKEQDSIKVSCIQGCVLSGDKWNDAGVCLETYATLTQEVSEEVQLVLWPESAVPINLASNSDLMEQYQALSAQIDAPILMGCFWEFDGKNTNSAVLLDEKNVSEPYSKQILVPFGERMPYRSFFSGLFPVLNEINMLSEDLLAGDSSALFDWNGKKIGSVVCFESVFSDVVRASVRDGANLLVIVTNDSWYEDSPAVWQHLAHAVFRSVENGRTTVRCANSGVSAIIDENGRIRESLGPMEQGILSGKASFSDENTLYLQTGDLVLPFLTVSAAVWFSIILFLERRRKHG